MPHKCDGPFNERDLENVLSDWEQLKYFPKNDPNKQARIMNRLARLPNCKSELEWIRNRLLEVDTEWQGMGRVRELFSMRFPPADGIESDAYTGEMAAITAPATSMKLLPARDGDPVRELEMTVYRERLGERVTAMLGELRTARAEALRSRTDELKDLEIQLAEDAAAANLNRRSPEESERAVDDLRLNLEIRHQKPLEGDNV